MVRIHKGWLAYGIAGALIVSAPLALADDPSQQDQNQSDQSGQTQGQSSDKSMQGQTQGQSVQGTQKGMTQEQKMDQEKGTLRDKVKKELDDSQAQIDTLQNDLKNKTGAARIRDERLLKQAIQYRDALNVDLQTIDNASAKDWNQIRATVNNDLTTFRGVVRRVAQSQKAPQPRQGRTQTQPQGGSQQQQQKSQ